MTLVLFQSFLQIRTSRNTFTIGTHCVRRFSEELVNLVECDTVQAWINSSFKALKAVITVGSRVSFRLTPASLDRIQFTMEFQDKNGMITAITKCSTLVFSYLKSCISPSALRMSAAFIPLVSTPLSLRTCRIPFGVPSLHTIF